MELMTSEEKAGLKARLDALLANRPNISKRIAEARELGDLKENAEYHSAREEQGMQEAEIHRLEQRIAQSHVIDDSMKSSDVVFFGATVRLVECDADGKPKGDEELFKLVGEATGSMTSDINEATASSPFGEALLKARVGEIIAVRGPRGMKRFKILAIV
jgi:transcription elongation factor GreA